MQLLKPYWIAKDGYPIFSIDIHPDGSRFATGGQGADSAGRIALWSMKSILKETEDDDPNVPKLLTQMDHHLGCVNCVRWSNSGLFLASGGDDKLIMIWKKSNYGAGNTIFGGGGKVNIESWRCAHTLRGHNGDVLDLAWSPGDKLLATASVDNTVIVWNAEKFPESVRTLRTHSGLVKGVAFDPIGKYLATQSDDKTLRVWKISDWKEETIVKDPFLECGATTHVLRPDWAPDGNFLVTAHAMNEGGPTAQIVDRDTWKTPRDFVGHKKAISCVRFNPNLLLKNKSQDFSNYFTAVALGSRDRSFSIWTTNLKRPFLVVTDVFDQSVLDISWSKDGRILMACSMDGSVAVVIMTEAELGRAISEEKTHDILTGTYGKSFKLPVVSSSSNGHQTNGVPIVLENPNLLKQKDENEMTNGMKPPENTIAVRKKPRGPTDKQIEARTADGRRRVTPIFIPLDETGMGGGTGDGTTAALASFGSGEFGSSSTQEKSRIGVEKRDDIVKPNVSPDKTKESISKNESTKNNNTNNERKTKTEENEKPMEVDDEEEEEEEEVVPVNTIAVRRKPRILDSSDEEEETTTTSKEVEVKNDKETAAKKDPAQESATKIAQPAPAAAKEVPKPNLVCGKRKISITGPDESERKKRGRPPMSRARDSGGDEDEYSYTPIKETTNQSYAKIISKTICSEMDGHAVLTPLSIDKSKSSQFTINEKKISFKAVNDYKTLEEGLGSVHLIKFSYENDLGQEGNKIVLLSSRIASVDLCLDYFIVTCLDSSLSIFSVRGERLFPPMMLPAPLAKITVRKDMFAAITTSGRFFEWKIMPGGKPRVIKSDMCILSLLQSNQGQSEVTVDRLEVSEEGNPLIVTGVGKSYVYDPDFGTWLKLTDQDDTVFNISSYARKRFPISKPQESTTTTALPLQSLEKSVAPSKTMNSVPSALRSLADLTYSEMQVASSRHLNSSEEVEWWALQQVRHLCVTKNEEKLREVLDSLINAENFDYSKCKKAQEIMTLIGKELGLQRLYLEYQERLESPEEIGELLKTVEFKC